MNKVAKEILEKLEDNGYPSYLVGGYVRDSILSRETSDIDICTSATPKEVKEIFAGEVNEYGVFNFKVNELNIDISTFRKEENYEMRKPTSIFYIKDLESDLLRRDFTINAICMDKNEKIIDKFDGIKDLENKVIRMVGDMDKKLEEDPLRILRAIRFATVLDFSIDLSLQEKIKEKKDLLCTLSPYRIKEEISKIFLSSNYKVGLEYLRNFDLCNKIGISFTNVNYTSDLCGMWAQVEIDKDIPFTKSEKENIVNIQEILSLKVISRAVIYKYGLYLCLVAGEILGISGESIHEMQHTLPIYERKDLDISFPEICEVLETSPSKEVKEIEDELIQEVLYERVLNEKDKLKEYLRLNKMRWFS